MNTARQQNFDRLADLAQTLRHVSVLRRHQMRGGMAPTGNFQANANGELAAAALCHIVAAYPHLLDPDGTLLEQLWPHETPMPVIDDAEASLARAVALLMTDIGRLEALHEPDARPNLHLIREGSPIPQPVEEPVDEGTELLACERCKVLWPLHDMRGHYCAWCVEDLDAEGR